MFICAVTGKVSKPGEPQIKVVVETRKVEYKNLINHEDERGRSVQVEKVSRGEEIVKEIAVTKEGFDQLQLTLLNQRFAVA